MGLQAVSTYHRLDIALTDVIKRSGQLSWSDRFREHWDFTGWTTAETVAACAGWFFSCIVLLPLWVALVDLGMVYCKNTTVLQRDIDKCMQALGQVNLDTAYVGHPENEELLSLLFGPKGNDGVRDRTRGLLYSVIDRLWEGWERELIAGEVAPNPAIWNEAAAAQLANVQRDYQILNFNQDEFGDQLTGIFQKSINKNAKKAFDAKRFNHVRLLVELRNQVENKLLSRLIPFVAQVTQELPQDEARRYVQWVGDQLARINFKSSGLEGGNLARIFKVITARAPRLIPDQANAGHYLVAPEDTARLVGDRDEWLRQTGYDVEYHSFSELASSFTEKAVRKRYGDALRNHADARFGLERVPNDDPDEEEQIVIPAEKCAAEVGALTARIEYRKALLLSIDGGQDRDDNEVAPVVFGNDVELTDDELDALPLPLRDRIIHVHEYLKRPLEQSKDAAREQFEAEKDRVAQLCLYAEGDNDTALDLITTDMENPFTEVNETLANLVQDYWLLYRADNANQEQVEENFLAALRVDEGDVHDAFELLRSFRDIEDVDALVEIVREHFAEDVEAPSAEVIQYHLAEQYGFFADSFNDFATYCSGVLALNRTRRVYFEGWRADLANIAGLEALRGQLEDNDQNAMNDHFADQQWRLRAMASEYIDPAEPQDDPYLQHRSYVKARIAII